MIHQRAWLVGLLIWLGCTDVTAQGSLPVIDTTAAWTGVAFSGFDAVGQTITASPSGASLTAFEFFSVVPPPFNPYVGGIFEWDEVAGAIVGGPLGSAVASPPTAPGFPPVATVAEARVRFDFSNPIFLKPNHQYLLTANSTQPRFAAPTWFVTTGSYPFGLAKVIFPPNGTVTGPWTTFTGLSPGPDAWAMRVYFAASPAASAIPTLGISVALALCLMVGGIGLLRLRNRRHRGSS